MVKEENSFTETLDKKMKPIKELNSLEMDLIDELKKRFEGEMSQEMMEDENMFYRFLKARNFQLDQAEDMLRKHLIWRKNNQMDVIRTDYEANPVVMKYLNFVRLGYDKEGSAVRYFGIGKCDCKGILKSVRRNDIIKTAVAQFEDDIYNVNQRNKKMGTSISNWTYVVDFDNFTFSKATHRQTLETLLALFQTYEANYPERLKVAYVINSSVYFTIFFSVLKPLLSPQTISKIVVYGKDGWKQELLNLIDVEILPPFLGGTNITAEKQIKDLTKMVSEEYFLSNKSDENRICNQPGAKKLTVARKSKMYLSLEVVESDSVIEWEFESENGDIGFGLCYKESKDESSELKELIPTQKVESHILTESGMYKCSKPGSYLLVFDNTHSWIHKKEIYCLSAVQSSSVRTQA